MDVFDRLRIDFVASTMKMGGAERGTYELARRMHQDGSDVELVCLRESGVVGDMCAGEGIPVHTGIAPEARDPRAGFRLWSRWRRRRPHAVYFLDHTNAVFWGAPAAAAAGVPVRLQVMHTTGLWGGGNSLPRGVRLALPFLTRVIATAHGQSEYLRELGVPAERLVTVRNGVDTADVVTPSERAELRRELDLHEDDLVVGMIAMFRPEKAHEVLFEAVEALRSRHPRLRVLLLGDGPRREELVTDAARRGLTDVVRFLGLRDDAPRVAAVFDVAVLTSYPLVETLPYSLLEAIAQGVPAVATRVGSLPEIVEHGEAGYLVEPGDPAAFGAALDRVLSDDDLRARLGVQGRAWILKEFSVERVVTETRAIIDQGLAGA